ncbi:MAG: LysR family transcriptional regulator [Deltaproteobacteria bacterium]|nr:LysR family transcriptional regulator [Deltaproteobacteria bacterium]
MPSIDFDLRQLEIFKNIVDLKSFSKAAKVVFLAQASVSERIATLEEMVGVRLLDRLGREVTPTKAGELLYKHAVLLLDMKKTACLEMQAFMGIKRGDIRLGGSTIPGEYILPKVLGLFCREHPMISVNLSVADSVSIETRVLNGSLELGIIGSKTTKSPLICQALWADELVLAIPAQHQWADRETVPVEALFEEPFIVRERGSGTFKIFDKYLRTKGERGLNALKAVARFGTERGHQGGLRDFHPFFACAGNRIGLGRNENAEDRKSPHAPQFLFDSRQKAGLFAPLCRPPRFSATIF